MSLTTQYVKIYIGGGYHCIKDFPDINPHDEADQIEVTTLCDEYHEYIDGLKNYNEPLEFTLNYDESTFYQLNVKEYDPTRTYNGGNLCRRNGIVMMCTSGNVTGDWDDTKWIVAPFKILLCNSANDTTGKNGKFEISSFDAYVRLKGAGVGDVLEMVLVIIPKSPITFSTVS